ncbi:MAG: hypothetical protein ACTSUB_07610 [Candidatus Thorarchaeota archaeon]
MSSGKQKLVMGFAIIGVVLLIGPSIIFPGPGLVPNATLNNEFIMGWGTNQYVAKLGAGTWTVSVSPSWILEFDIHVTTGLFLLPNLLASDESDISGGKSVTFTLNESAVVYIKIVESSVYHDSTGFYDIRITGDGESFDSFFPLALNFMVLVFILPVALFFFGFICICLSTRKQRHKMRYTHRSEHLLEYFTPVHQPQRHDGPDLRTIRLPTKCPTCSADLSDSNVDWTGPMEATCLHCGAVIQAKFERI